MQEIDLKSPVSEQRLKKVRDYIAQRAPLVAEGRKMVVSEDAVNQLMSEALRASSHIARFFPLKRKAAFKEKKIRQLKAVLMKQFNEAAADLPFDGQELKQEADDPKRTLMMASPEKLAESRRPDEKRDMFAAWLCLRHALVKAGAHLETIPTAPKTGGFREVYTRDRYLMINGTAYLPDPEKLQDKKVGRGGQNKGYIREILQVQKELEDHGIKTEIVKGAWFEGGNVIRHFGSKTIFVGIHGEWSSEASAQKLLDAINAHEKEPWSVVNVPLKNYSQMYHMDTGMSEELPHGEVMLSPRLTDEVKYREICRIVGPQNIIELDSDQETLLATNFIDVGDTLVLTGQCDELKKDLERRGYTVVLPRDYDQNSFEFGHGGVHCMTNDVPQKSRQTQAQFALKI